MKAQSRALGLNKQHINMARLKVKQISDFTSSVQALIDNDVDQNASIIEQISEDLSNEIDATSGDVSSIDLEISTSKSTDVVLSDALSNEIDATSVDVASIDVVLGTIATGTALGSLETRLSNDEDDLSTEILETSADVSSIDLEISTSKSTDVVHSTAISTETSRIDAILSDANTDLDAFNEVVSYINSLESADSLDTVADLASMETRFSNLESTDVVISNELSDEVSSIDVRLSSGDVRFSTIQSTDVVLSDALSNEIDATSVDVASIDVVLGTIATGSALGSLETRLSNDEDDLSTEILETSADVSSIDVRLSSVDSTDVVLSNALSAEILATSGDVSSIDVRFSGTDSGIASLETSLDGFAKEAFVQAITSDIVGGSSGNGSIDGPDGALGFSGSVGNWAENGTGTVVFDLNDPIEGNNAGEYQQNIVSLTINGLEVGHQFIRVTQPTTINVDFAGQFSGGATLEADDVIEFKYIKD